MPVIYEPTGKAREFGDLACNLYDGCSHGCVYCYAPGVLRKSKAAFGNPAPRKDILKRLEKDAKKYRGSETPVFLCFTCDPYQPCEDEYMITRQAIEILSENECAINILTKGGLRATRDFDLLKLNPLNWFGVTLTYASPQASDLFEPGAALPGDRIESLRLAKNSGLNTWISFEPIVSPLSVIGLIEYTKDFCDLYKIGKLNHCKGDGPSVTELRKYIKEAIETLDMYGKEYYIKEDTRPILNGE